MLTEGPPDQGPDYVADHKNRDGEHLLLLRGDTPVLGELWNDHAGKRCPHSGIKDEHPTGEDNHGLLGLRKLSDQKLRQEEGPTSRGTYIGPVEGILGVIVSPSYDSFVCPAPGP